MFFEQNVKLIKTKNNFFVQSTSSVSKFGPNHGRTGLNHELTIIRVGLMTKRN